MNKENTNTLTKLSAIQKWTYRIILILMPVIILFLIEGLLRVFGFGNNYNLFVNYPGKEFANYKICNPIIGKKYFQMNEPSSPPQDMFLKNKPDNGFRIFVLGSSTVAGFPYDQNLLFSRILQERLQDCYPQKYIEIVNTAITATNSYTFLDYMNEILEEKPDAILFYEGHNEFYGALGIGSNEHISKYRNLAFLHLRLLHLRIYQLIRNSITGIGKMAAGKNSTNNVKGTLMRRIAKNKKIGYKSDVYNAGIKQFRDNMTDFFKKAKKRNIPIFISEVVSNIRDQKPFCSVATAQYPAAISVFNKAVEYEKKGEFSKAKKFYYVAKDLDCVRFRASEEINDNILDLASKYSAILVPMKLYFEKNSPNKIMGNNLFTEHLHPNIDGYFLMADAFFNEIVKSKLISDRFNIVYYKNSDYYKRNWGYTAFDSVFAYIRVNTLKCQWPFQPINAPFTDFRKSFVPRNIIDSMALAAIMKGDANNVIADAHFELAEYYKKRGDNYNAFKEFYARIKCFPYLSKDYLNAAGCLMKTNDLSLALKLINKSLEIKETYYGYFMKGEIQLLRKEYEPALESFNKASAYSVNSDQKVQLMSKQCVTYHFYGQLEKSNEIFNELLKIDPGFKPDLSLNSVDFTMLVPVQVKDKVARALDYYKKGNLNAALKEFLESLQIKETAIANRYAGEILIRQNDKNAMILLLRAYPDYKNDLTFLYNLCMLNLKYKNSAEAQNIMYRIKQLNPNSIYIPRIEKLLQPAIN